MTPVPCEAGLSITVLAPNAWVTSCGMVVPTMRHLDQVLLRVLDALADRLGNLARLAQPNADVAGAVADDDDRAEREAAAALDDFGDAVDLDDTLFERQSGGVDPGQWVLLVSF